MKLVPTVISPTSMASSTVIVKSFIAWLTLLIVYDLTIVLIAGLAVGSTTEKSLPGKYIAAAGSGGKSAITIEAVPAAPTFTAIISSRLPTVYVPACGAELSITNVLLEMKLV